ncbi:MAG: phosphate/phosphite/phosphonate ABC transporter substrate-binding protein [Ignavibacteria bacterium]|nr:phosphate/phosphite/phosphonate ABC transporter substrate-binding protein [Ignavibacteria bacterium]
MLLDKLKYFRIERIKSTLLYILLIIVIQTGIVNSQSSSDNVGLFQVAFSTNVFKGVYLNDAIAVAKVLTQQLLKEYDEEYEVLSPATFDNVQELDELLEKQEVEVFVMHSTELIQAKNREMLEPIGSASREGMPYEIYYLLVNNQSEHKTLEDLKGKTLLVGFPYEGDIPLIWLDQVLKQNKLITREKFFNKIEYFDKALPSVLPVFFKKSDACLVSKNSFETICELNPQVQNKLTVIETSIPITIGIVALRKNISNPEVKSHIIDAFLNLHNKVAAQQFLSVFKIEKVIEFKEEYLKSTYEILNLKN